METPKLDVGENILQGKSLLLPVPGNEISFSHDLVWLWIFLNRTLRSFNDEVGG